MSRSIRAGVDVGGTFTDFVGLHPEHGWVQLKRPTTRPDPAEGILAGLRELYADLDELDVAHGTTAATNVALERAGPRTALIVTAGFRDILQLGRGERLQLYAVQPSARPALVAEHHCYEVHERLDSQGRVLLPLDEAEVRRLAEQLRADGVEAVAVCLLFAYLNPAHELRLAESLRQAGFEVALSHQVDPQPKEFERASTTVMHAYVAPSLRDYLAHLNRQLRSLWVVRSSGAVCRPHEAVEQAVGCLLSGPAAGLQGAWQIARQLGVNRFMTVDVGGTSTDVALVDRDLPFLEESSIGGIPFRCAQADIHTVGAGGGSVAHQDALGLLAVGPRSAGAVPGPAAYGHGGPVTVTDALLALGRLPSQLAGGRLSLDPEASTQALSALAAELKLAPLETAAAIVALAEQTMAQALRYISLERGYDASEFVLVAYGGGGGSHAASLAEQLGMDRVLIPPAPGLLCAYGALLAPWQAQRRRSWARPWNAETQALLDEWVQRSRTELRAQAAAGALTMTLWLELRYLGQGSTLWLRAGANLARRFASSHRRRYGYERPEHPLELVSSRLEARQSRALQLPAQAHQPLRTQQGRAAWGLPPRWHSVLVAEGLGELRGPARLDRPDGTVWVPSGWRARPHESGALWLELHEKEEELVK